MIFFACEDNDNDKPNSHNTFWWKFPFVCILGYFFVVFGTVLETINGNIEIKPKIASKEPSWWHGTWQWNFRVGSESYENYDSVCVS